MARLDIKTLVLAFENRITELEKNPPDKIPLSVTLNLLERAVEEVIKEHFRHLIKLELEKTIKDEFHHLKNEYVKKITDNVFNDVDFRRTIEKDLKKRILGDYSE